MYAVVTTWRDLEADASRSDLLAELVRRGIGFARRAGVVDVIMIEADPDLLISISLFESREDWEAAESVAGQFVDSNYAERLERVSRVAGDVYELTDVVDIDLAALRREQPP